MSRNPFWGEETDEAEVPNGFLNPERLEELARAQEAEEMEIRSRPRILHLKKKPK